MKCNRTFILLDAKSRDACAKFVQEIPKGWTASFAEPRRNLPQNARMHAMIDDIAEQWEFCGRLWDAEDMKRLLIDQFRRDTIKDPAFAELWKAMRQVDLAPAIDGTGVVALGVQSRRFSKELATAFISWLFAFGDERNIRWTDPTIVPIEAYRETA